MVNLSGCRNLSFSSIFSLFFWLVGVDDDDDRFTSIVASMNALAGFLAGVDKRKLIEVERWSGGGQ